jgi:hypothetical protein
MEVVLMKLWQCLLATLGLFGATTMIVLAQPAQRTVDVRLNTLRVLDEDDPFSNDEPYLIVTGFKLRVQLAGTGIQVVPGTLAVQNQTCGHNTLRSDDNWADEVNNYSLPSKVGLVRRAFPRAETGWVVGAIVTLMDEDGFARDTARTVCRWQSEQAQKVLQSLDVNGIAGGDAFDILLGRLARGIAKKLGGNFSDFIRGLISAVDPDDFGGANLVMTVNMPDGTVRVLSGDLMDFNQNTLPTKLLNAPRAPTNFTLRYPLKSQRFGMPDRAFFLGSYRVFGRVSLP